jgi:hypothetical protein
VRWLAHWRVLTTRSRSRLAQEALSKARYGLRSDGLTNQFGSPDNLVLTPEQVTTYNSSLGVAQDAILSVSRLEGELRTFPDTFTQTQAITRKLDHMKRFLTGLVDEFEKVRPAQQIRFADLKNLMSFTGRPHKHRT